MSIKRMLAVMCALFMLTVTLFSCRAQAYEERSFWHMDTPIVIRLYGAGDEADGIFANCQRIITEGEAKLSRTMASSEIARWNASSDGSVPLSEDTLALIAQACEIAEVTQGAFDPTVYPFVELWALCDKEQRLPDAAELEARGELVSYKHLRMENGMVTKVLSGVQMDLGGIGKGYLMDRVLAYLEGCNLTGALVSFGSNVGVVGEKADGKPYKIAIKNPYADSGLAGYLSMEHGVLSVSGDYERYVTIGDTNYHHILDPATGYPTQNELHSVAVLCEDGALADALSTALMVMGYERAMSLYASNAYEFEAIFIFDDRATWTSGLDGCFVTTDK